MALTHAMKFSVASVLWSRRRALRDVRTPALRHLGGSGEGFVVAETLASLRPITLPFLFSRETRSDSQIPSEFPRALPQKSRRSHSPVRSFPWRRCREPQ